jgi:hypothetical protein
MCSRRGIDLVKPTGKLKMINDLNEELARVGAYNALKKKQVTAWAELRNNAAHGKTEAYTSGDVDTFVRDVSDFCSNYSWPSESLVDLGITVPPCPDAGFSLAGGLSLADQRPNTQIQIRESGESHSVHGRQFRNLKS